MKNGENTSKVKLLNLKEVEGFYIFADIRGFSRWANNNLSEVGELLEITYSQAFEFFGDLSKAEYLRRVVKLLGDGFFAVREYNRKSKKSFNRNLIQTIGRIIKFKQSFQSLLSASILHEKSKLDISFGLSYGISRRFYLSGFPQDYAGDKINLASRLCSIAEPSVIVVEHDLKEYISKFAKQRIFNLKKSRDEKVNIKGFGERDIFVIDEISEMENV